MTTNHPTTELLSDEALTKIEASQVKRRESLTFHQSEYPGLPSPSYIEEIDALCQTVRALKVENELAEKVFKFILPNRPLATISELAKPALDEVDALREQLAHRTIELENESRETQKWNNRANQLAIEGQELRQHVAQLTRERDDYRDQLVEAKAETVERLAQVEKERNDLRAKAINLCKEKAVEWSSSHKGTGAAQLAGLMECL